MVPGEDNGPGDHYLNPKTVFAILPPMPRTPRRCPGGLVFHVLNRAVAKIKLFRHDNDYVAFEHAFAQAYERFPLEIFAYTVMPNHWHFVLRPKRDGDLTAFMQWLTLTHAQRWRTSHKTVGYGPLYQGRFKAFAIEQDEHLETVLRYVERNPLRAKLVENAEDWRWGSLHRRTHNAHEERAPLSDWPIPRRSDWLKFVNRPQTTAEEQAIAKSIRRSCPFGKPTWQSQMAERLDLAHSLRPVGRPPIQAQATLKP
jgi:putative transposase